MLLVGPSGALALFQQIGDAPSPATGHAQIVAQGVSFLPDGNAAWRIVEDTAEPLDAAVPEERALGFSVALDQGILINDYTYGTQARLAADEAAFVGSGVSQQRVSLDGNNAPYLRIALVPANQANEAGGDTMVYAGDSFNAPDGRRDIDLLRDVLQDGEETLISAGEAPSLIHVIGGSVSVDDGNDVFTLDEGESATIDGEMMVTGQSDDATIIAGIIGPDVPAPPRFTGTVTLDIRACPADVTRETLEANAANGSDAGFRECEAVADPANAGVRVNLNLPDGDRLRLSDADLTDEDGVVVWDGLVFGDYVLGRVTAFPEGYGDYLVTDGNLGLVQRGNITLNRDDPDAYRVIYLIAEPVETGSITVEYYVCSVANFEEFDAAACDPFEGGMNTEVIINDAPSQTRDDAEQLDSATFEWSGLPVAADESPQGPDEGFYLLAFEQDDTAPSPRVVVEGADRIEAAGGYAVRLTPEQPDATVRYYLVNVLGETQGNIYIVGMTCPDASASLAECDMNGSAPLPAVVITTDGGGVIDQTSAVASGDAYVWTDLELGFIYTVSAASITAPEGYTIRTIVHYQTGANGNEHSVSLTEDSPLADFIVYLDPAGDVPPVDTDEDGLSDDDETDIYGTDPAQFDTDGDCYGDGTEVSGETDPLDPASFPEGACDAPDA
jgi:hypothetical protein